MDDYGQQQVNPVQPEEFDYPVVPLSYIQGKR